MPYLAAGSKRCNAGSRLVHIHAVHRQSASQVASIDNSPESCLCCRASPRGVQSRWTRLRTRSAHASGRRRSPTARRRQVRLSYVHAHPEQMGGVSRCWQQWHTGVLSRAAEQVDSALRALRVLSEQTHLLDCTSESVTEGVHVEMTSTFLQASPHSPAVKSLH
jgi:hypothetical protein